jgi:hypothetical protein
MTFRGNAGFGKPQTMFEHRAPEKAAELPGLIGGAELFDEPPKAFAFTASKHDPPESSAVVQPIAHDHHSLVQSERCDQPHRPSST